MKIIDRLSLPAISAPETDALDWKKQVDATKRQELAKDMAAMANAAGGSIVIGVKEGSAAVSAALHPMSRSEVYELAVAYERVAKEMVSPPPRIDAAHIELDHDGSGKWVLAVNVSPTEAIFCAVKVVAEASGQSREASWLIPRRIASQTKFLTPAEAQLLTVEKLRSATNQTLALIENWQDDLKRREKVRRFEEFMINESHHDIRLPESGADEESLGLEYTIRPVRDENGTPLHDKSEVRSRWVVEVVGPAHESVMTEDDLAEYEYAFTGQAIQCPTYWDGAAEQAQHHGPAIG